jgi:hypothetical protein
LKKTARWKSVQTQNALAYAPGDEFPKSVNLEDPSVTLVPADVLILKLSLLPVTMIYVQ